MSEDSPVERAWLALEKDDQELIKAAVQDLHTLQDLKPAIAVLGECLGCQYWAIRRQAAGLLSQIGGASLPRLSQLVRKGSTHQVYWSCIVLARIERAPAPILHSVLSSPDQEHRLYALHALARRREPDAITSLITALDDPAWALRKRAADALATRDDLDLVVDLVRDELPKGNRNRVYWGVHVITRILGERALPILMKLLPWEDDDLRHLVIVAVAKFSVEGIESFLIEYLGDRSLLIRRKAADLLVSRGPAAVIPLLSKLDSATPEAQFWGLQALMYISPPDFYAKCRWILNASPADLKYIVIQALGLARSPQALDLLLERFRDPLWVVRKTASDEIVSLGTLAIPYLKAAMQAPDSDDDMRFWCIETLGRIGGPAVVHLSEALLQGDATARGFVLAALSEAELPLDVIPTLVEALNDEQWPLRRKAADILLAMGTRALPKLTASAFSEVENIRFWTRKVFQAVLGDSSKTFLESLDQLTEDLRKQVITGLSSATGQEFSELLTLDPTVVAATVYGLAERERLEKEKELVPESAGGLHGPARNLSASGVYRSAAYRRSLAAEAASKSGSYRQGGPENSGSFVRPFRPGNKSGSASDEEQIGEIFQSGPKRRPISRRDVEIPEPDSPGMIPPPIETAPMEDLPGDPSKFMSRLLREVARAGGSEVNLRAGGPPVARILDQLTEIGDQPLTTMGMDAVLASILGVRPSPYNTVMEVAFDLATAGRCRARIFRDSRGPVVVLKALGFRPPQLSDVGDEESLREFSNLPHGLIVLSGPPASGKTYTAAAMIDAINSTRAVQIGTVESPVEHTLYPTPGFVTQVQVPADFATYSTALRFVRSCAPAVIFLADLPDRETTKMALDAANTALVIAIVEASSAAEAIQVVAEQAGSPRNAALQSIAKCLVGSINQQLLPNIDGKNWVAAREIMEATQEVVDLIQQDEMEQLEQMLSGEYIGIRPRRQAITELQSRGLVSL